MGKNIKHQMQEAISNNFQEGVDKHAEKHKNIEGDSTQVYSYSEKFRLLDTARMLQNFIKENGLEIKQVKDISSDVVQNFLNSKINTCTQNTINTYSQSLNKISSICNKNFKSCNLTWKQDVVVPTAISEKSKSRGVGNQMPIEVLDKMCNYARQNYSISGQVLLAQRELGLRINEITTIKLENINFKNKELILKNTKGGKVLVREINPKLEEIIRETIQKNNITSGRLFNVENKTVNQYYRRLQINLGVKGRYSNHNIRSAVAQEKYDQLREKGVSSQEALKVISVWLNHGENRKMLLKNSYIRIH